MFYIQWLSPYLSYIQDRVFQAKWTQEAYLGWDFKCPKRIQWNCIFGIKLLLVLKHPSPYWMKPFGTDQWSNKLGSEEIHKPIESTLLKTPCILFPAHLDDDPNNALTWHDDHSSGALLCGHPHSVPRTREINSFCTLSSLSNLHCGHPMPRAKDRHFVYNQMSLKSALWTPHILGQSLTIKGCVRVSVRLSRYVIGLDHFWFKYPQPVQWH